jgi:hypothetical protein
LKPQILFSVFFPSEYTFFFLILSPRKHSGSNFQKVPTFYNFVLIVEPRESPSPQSPKQGSFDSICHAPIPEINCGSGWIIMIQNYCTTLKSIDSWGNSQNICNIFL